MEENAKILRVRVVKLEQSLKKKAMIWMVQAKRKTSDIKVVVNQGRTERTEHNACINELERIVHELQSNFAVAEKCIRVADS